MKILMLSMEKALLGQGIGGGDAIERHKKYGQFCDELHIIVLSAPGYQVQKLSKNVFVWPTSSKNKFLYLKNALQLAVSIHQKNALDLIMCQDIIGYIGLKVSQQLKRKFLLSIHGDFFDNQNNRLWTQGKWFNRFLILMLKRMVNKADGLRVVSQGIKDKLVKKGIKQDKIRVIPTPVDLSKFATFTPAQVDKLKQKYPGKNILFVGRLEPVKNLNWFLNIFKEIKTTGRSSLNLRFLIVGQGSLKTDLEKKVGSLNLKGAVKFIGQVAHDDMINYYHLSDIVVLPSTSESFGKVLVEAGAAGVPCVVTATTGAKEIIQDKQTGFIVAINDKEKMIEKIVSLLNDEKLASQMGESAKKYVQDNLNGEVITQKIVKFWQELINL